MKQKTAPKVLCIVGPTSSGKTSLGVTLAKNKMERITMPARAKENKDFPFARENPWAGRARVKENRVCTRNEGTHMN